MTDIEKKALALLNEVEPEIEPWTLYDIKGEACFETLCRAIEQHEAFRQEVSDAVEQAQTKDWDIHPVLWRFIIAKPDPLVDVWLEAFPGNHVDDARDECAKISAALAKRGGKIVWEGE